jgi:hypothetical protein
MRVEREHLERVLLGRVLAPDLRPREEEALLRTQPVDRRARRGRRGELRLESAVGKLEAAQVRDVLAARQLACCASGGRSTQAGEGAAVAGGRRETETLPGDVSVQETARVCIRLALAPVCSGARPSTAAGASAYR